MNHKGLKLVLFAGVALAAIGLFVPAANAGWWWGGSPAYAYGGCGGCCGGGGDWGGGFGCGCGGHHHCGHHCCGGGSWTAWNPCCGSCYSTWSPCGCGCGGGWGTTVNSCGCGAMADTVTLSGGTMAPTPAPAAPTPPVAPGATAPSSTGATVPPVTPPTGPTPPLSTPSATEPGGLPLPTGHGASLDEIREDGCLLTVWVPHDATVTINGNATKSTGSRRQFVSYGLRPGYSYTYQVVAKLAHEGKEYTESKTISVTAGQRGGVAFGFNETALPEAQTASN